MHNLFKNIDARRIKPDGSANEVAAGTTDTLTSDTIDTINAQGVLIEVLFGTITATGTAAIKVQYSADGSTAWTDVTGAAYTALAASSSGKCVALEIFKPPARYLRVLITRATANAVIDSMLVKLFALAHRAPSLNASYSNYTAVNNP